MYKCQITGRQSERNQGPQRLVVRTRPKTYYKWVKNEETLKWEQIQVATGWEIVQELSVSQEGKDLWESWTPEERESFLKHMRG